MTIDGQFSLEDLDEALQTGFEGMGLGDAIDMANAAVLHPVMDDGSEVDPASFDPDEFMDGVVDRYIGARAAERAARALAYADMLSERGESETAAGIQAVTGVSPETYAEAKVYSAAGDSDALTRILSDYMERS